MITNKLGLPLALVRALQHDSYDPGESDITVTQLIDPPFLVRLSKEEVDEDASEMTWRFYGTLFHNNLEKFAGPDALTEVRFYTTVNKWKVGGKLDILENGVLTDWKTTSTWASEGKQEWEQQLNLLRLLCELNGFQVGAIQIVAFYKDWTAHKKGTNGYPSASVGVIPVKMWSMEKAMSFLEERVRAHQDPNPPPCTDEERWMTEKVFALMPNKGKRAIKLFKSLEEAEEAEEATKGTFIQPRPTSYRRCEAYCRVRSICPVLKQEASWEG